MSTVINGTGNLTLEDNKIKGDFSNATIANRVMFQTSTTNGQTTVSAIPNGTGSVSQFTAYSGSDPANASGIAISQVGTTESRLQGVQTGSGSYSPMTFYTGGVERMRIDTSGNVLVTNAAGGLGYGTGSGGTVTQATSKSTAVTLNKPTGQITMNNASLAAGARVSFTVNNSVVGANDVVVVNLTGGSVNPDDYRFRTRVTSGAFVVIVTNENAGALGEALVLQFAIIKGATT